MKYKKWSKDIWRAVENALKQVPVGETPVAAFDADGTLWDSDMGEDFFRYQIAHKLVPGLPADPWNHYWHMKESGDPRPAYLWLAQINKGFEIATVQGWAASAVKANPPPIFEEASRAIEFFQKEGVKVYVVTASVKWAVEPGAALLGIPQDQVLGVTTQIIDGKVSDQPGNVIPYREGKAELLLQATNGQAPCFACGNTIGDSLLLASSKGIALAVTSAKEGSELYKSERGLQQEAQQKGWLTHQY